MAGCGNNTDPRVSFGRQCIQSRTCYPGPGVHRSMARDASHAGPYVHTMYPEVASRATRAGCASGCASGYDPRALDRASDPRELPRHLNAYNMVSPSRVRSQLGNLDDGLRFFDESEDEMATIRAYEGLPTSFVAGPQAKRDECYESLEEAEADYDMQKYYNLSRLTQSISADLDPIIRQPTHHKSLGVVDDIRDLVCSQTPARSYDGGCGLVFNHTEAYNDFQAAHACTRPQYNEPSCPF